MNLELSGVVKQYTLRRRLRFFPRTKRAPCFQKPFRLHVDINAQDGVNILFGRSGAGKTTALRLISGMLTPDSGKIVFNGTVFFDSEKDINLPIHQRNIGFVFQNYALFPHMSAYDNIAYGAVEVTRIEEYLDLFKIAHLKDRHPFELSGGEQQRVAVLRALATKPKLMLLDEPLSSVDEEVREVLLDELMKIRLIYKIPFIYVTHNVSEALRIGDFVYVIDEGRIVKSGEPAQVLNTPGRVREMLSGTEQDSV